MSDTETHHDAGQKSMKVTDRRMFTPEGELREEFRHLEDARPPSEAAPVRESEPPRQAEPEPPPSREPPPGEPETDPDAPSFYDLVTILAENASIYLRNAGAPGAEGAQSRELAKLHIDLLAVLERKTAGNLDSQEKAMLDEMLYRLRLAFAGQGGF